MSAEAGIFPSLACLSFLSNSPEEKPEESASREGSSTRDRHVLKKLKQKIQYPPLIKSTSHFPIKKGLFYRKMEGTFKEGRVGIISAKAFKGFP